MMQPCTLSDNKRTGAWSGALQKQLAIQGGCTTFTRLLHSPLSPSGFFMLWHSML